MQRNTTHIRTSHVGRLPPPKGWEDMPARLASAEIMDPTIIAAQVMPAIVETVRRQVETGIDCIGDGEFWTARSLAHYAAHFTGIEARPWLLVSRRPPGTRPASVTNEWRVWQEAKLPAGKMLMPGVVSHGTNLVEHPALVADRILRYAAIVGRENVVAGLMAASAAASMPTSPGPSCARLSKARRSRRRRSGLSSAA